MTEKRVYSLMWSMWWECDGASTMTEKRVYSLISLRGCTPLPRHPSSQPYPAGSRCRDDADRDAPGFPAWADMVPGEPVEPALGREGGAGSLAMSIELTRIPIIGNSAGGP
jgi:hypothetical protein